MSDIARVHSSSRPAVGGYETLQLSMSLRLLKDMAKAPKELFRHIPSFPASLVFALSIGRELEEHDLVEVQKILADFVFDINPGAHLVDTFPMLDLLPLSLAVRMSIPLQCSAFILHNMVLSSHSSRTHVYFCH
jgi:hypothetical protein